MHTGRKYRLREFLFWTRIKIFWLSLLGLIPVILYQYFGLNWLAIPFTIIGLLGTATVFIITFRNQETYNRTLEARKIWGATMSATRSWVMMCRDYLHDADKSRELIDRHFAWLTALRYQLRSPKEWENVSKKYNRAYLKHYSIPEWETAIEEELINYISREEMLSILPSNNRAAQVMALQSITLRSFREQGVIDEFRFLDMHGALREFSEHQGRSERIKNFPYPRQYATVNDMFVRLFCFLLPFGLLQEFDSLNERVTGIWQGNMVWLVVPFSVLISWVFTSLEQVGESTENPFEGNANDVPISQMARTAEIDMLEMLGESELPPALHPRNNIVL